MLSTIALLVSAVLALSSFAGTALYYRFLPENVNMNPLLDSGMVLPRPAIFVIPVFQAGLLILIYLTSHGASASPRNAQSDFEAAIIIVGLSLVLLLIQMWFVMRTRVSARGGT
jgi:hypothetical protein